MAPLALGVALTLGVAATQASAASVVLHHPGGPRQGTLLDKLVTAGRSISGLDARNGWHASACLELLSFQPHRLRAAPALQSPDCTDPARSQPPLREALLSLPPPCA